MRSDPQPALPPRGVIFLGSVVLIVHLLAGLIFAFHTESGPWPLPMGASRALPPHFSLAANESFARPYHQALKIFSPFHFESNHHEVQEISFEVTLRDSSGKLIGKKQFPDPSANLWIRHRQKLLALRLGNDEPMPPQEGVKLAPVGQTLPNVRWWHQENEHLMKLKEDTPNAVPRNQPVSQPSPWAYMIAKSYARHLSRTHDNAQVEMVRIWYDPVFPSVLFGQELPPPETFSRYQASYGDLTK